MKGFFNVLKGAYPSLKQLDKSLPVKAGDAVVRGSLMVVDAGEFRLSVAADAGGANAPGPVCYFAFHGADDPDVEMAGVNTGMPCVAPCEIETDQWATLGTPATDFAVGNYVQAGDGVLAPFVDDSTAVGVVTKAPYYRWSNPEDAPGALVGKRTGNRVQVIAVHTLYIPNLSTSA
jgi:hypothetical protein